MVSLPEIMKRFDLNPVQPKEIDKVYVERKTSNGTFEHNLLETIRLRKFKRILLIGGRGCGKTSLNHYIVSKLNGTGILIIMVSKQQAPQRAREIIDEIAYHIKRKVENSEIKVASGENLSRLLSKGLSTDALVENLKLILKSTSMISRVLIIIDELDRGNPGNDSIILSEIESYVTRMGTNVDLLASMAPITAKNYLDVSVRDRFTAIEIPALEKQNIVELIRKRIDDDPTLNVQVSEIIDENALNLLMDISIGMTRRFINVYRQALQEAEDQHDTKVTRQVVEKAFDHIVAETRARYLTATRVEKQTIAAIQERNWEKALSHPALLNNLIDKFGYVIESGIADKPFIIAPELSNSLEAEAKKSLKDLTPDDVDKLSSDLLYLGQSVQDGSPFTIKKSDLTRGVAIYGLPGSGKTVLLKVIVEEAAFHGINVVLFDVKGDLAGLKYGATTVSQSSLLKYGLTMESVRKLGEKACVSIMIPGPGKSGNFTLNSIVPPLKISQVNEDRFRTYIDELCGWLLELIKIDKEEGDEVATCIKLLLKHISLSDEPKTLKHLAELILNPPEQIKGLSSQDSFKLKKMVSGTTLKKVYDLMQRFLAGPDSFLFEKREAEFQMSNLISDKSNQSKIAIISISNLTDQQKGIVITWVLRWLDFFKEDFPGTEENPKFLVCIDEVWKPFRNTSVKKVIESLLRLNRSFGQGYLLATHFPDDLPTHLRVGKKGKGLLQVCFNVVKGQPIEFDNGSGESKKFKARWLLTRHDVNINPEDLLRIKSLELL